MYSKKQFKGRKSKSYANKQTINNLLKRHYRQNYANRKTGKSLINRKPLVPTNHYCHVELMNYSKAISFLWGKCLQTKSCMRFFRQFRKAAEKT